MKIRELIARIDDLGFHCQHSGDFVWVRDSKNNHVVLLRVKPLVVSGIGFEVCNEVEEDLRIELEKISGEYTVELENMVLKIVEEYNESADV